VTQFLRNTGSPQQDSPQSPTTQRIGSRPELLALIAQLPPQRDRIHQIGEDQRDQSRPVLALKLRHPVARFGRVTISIVVRWRISSSVGHSSGSTKRSQPSSVKASVGRRATAPSGCWICSVATGRVVSLWTTTWHAEAARALKNEGVLQRLAASGSIPIGAGPEECDRHIRTEIERWNKVLTAAGVQPTN
jgi:hypothetical protein